MVTVVVSAVATAFLFLPQSPQGTTKSRQSKEQKTKTGQIVVVAAENGTSSTSKVKHGSTHTQNKNKATTAQQNLFLVRCFCFSLNKHEEDALQ